jgi:hypothetical protein
MRNTHFDFYLLLLSQLMILLTQTRVGAVSSIWLFLCPSRRAFAKAALVDESYDAFAGHVFWCCRLPSGIVLLSE